ncbi:type II TA system antitoxin MqsA family protein [Natroniella sp. ANB-PHB2]|uniref:type II TA system antitoxin MqsA family protein n=1 Tax=Natroniella sp. ANB-PHB2 TaxID=3384444 RepID=UPI0038D3EB63
MEKFCPECLQKQKFKKIKDEIIHEVKNESFTNEIKKIICEKCGEEIIEDEEFDKSLLMAFNKYREKYNLLFPSKIKSIRKKYDLSQRDFADIIGCSVATINRYENGALQDNVHDHLIRLIDNPENMDAIIKKNKDKIKTKTIKKMKKKLSELIKESKKSKLKSTYIEFLQDFEERFTGFKKFNIEKMANVIVFFTGEIPNLPKSKLLKLIWYSEFVNFKRTSLSICGTPFQHYKYGPVPLRFKHLLAIIEEDLNAITHEEIFHPYMGEVFKANIEFDKSLFSEEEIETLNLVYNQFKDYTASEICARSHDEKGYRETNHEDLIPYDYADAISI